MSEIEELFEKKLSGHSLEPGAAAWERIEAGLSKKNEKIIWIQWAAAFFLCGLLFTTMWLRSTQENLPIAKTVPGITPQKNEVVKENRPALAAETKKSRKSNSVKKNIPAQLPAIKQIEEEVVPEEKTNDLIEVAVVNKPVVIEKNIAPEAAKPIVLVYTLETIEHSEHTADPMVADKKEGIKKVMQFARDVKNGDSPLGIRDMKDELFALDFKKSTKKQH
jgi:hypothetical protein